jgi:hypothetical protein
LRLALPESRLFGNRRIPVHRGNGCGASIASMVWETLRKAKARSAIREKSGSSASTRGDPFGGHETNGKRIGAKVDENDTRCAPGETDVVTAPADGAEATASGKKRLTRAC